MDNLQNLMKTMIVYVSWKQSIRQMLVCRELISETPGNQEFRSGRVKQRRKDKIFSYQVSLLRTMKCICFCSPREQKGKVFSKHFQMPLVKGEPMYINSITFPMHMHECWIGSWKHPILQHQRSLRARSEGYTKQCKWWNATRFYFQKFGQTLIKISP